MPFVSPPSDHLGPVWAELALLWGSAKLGGEVALRLRLPAVVGELAAGGLLAGLSRAGVGIPDLGASATLQLLAGLGVVLLMFAVGLESTPSRLRALGLPSLRVAVAGMLLPMLLVLGAAGLLLPSGTPFVVHLFLGACLCATSIGISARVLREHGVGRSAEGQVIMGAAVLDDVLGLLVLVAVSALVRSFGGASGPPWRELALSLLLAGGFLAAALTAGPWISRHLFRIGGNLRGEEVLLPLALAFAFLMAWLGSRAGLAGIVGAYAAGLVLEPAHVEGLEAREARPLKDLLHPLVASFAPLYFVLMGTRVEVPLLLRGRTLLMALVLGVLGLFGKWLAGFAADRRLRGSVIGWGMVPRGEVGLIFVATGAGLQVQGRPLLGPELSTALVGAIFLTTLLGPLGLGWALDSAKVEAR